MGRRASESVWRTFLPRSYVKLFVQRFTIRSSLRKNLGSNNASLSCLTSRGFLPSARGEGFGCYPFRLLKSGSCDRFPIRIRLLCRKNRGEFCFLHHLSAIYLHLCHESGSPFPTPFRLSLCSA